MPRVIGIDPGTLSIDICGLDNGRVFLDLSLPTTEALRDPWALLTLIDAAGPIDLVVGPSGYGLPLHAAHELSESDLRLAYLNVNGDSGGIGGLRTLLRMLGRFSTSVVVTPGVVHLPTVPAHRKLNRVDLGTADKVCAAALAIHEQAEQRNCGVRDVSLILLELGGAFTAALAVRSGSIVDGVGGSSGPIGLRACGALDGEVAMLAGTITKGLVFSGGVATVAGASERDPIEALIQPQTEAGRIGWEAFVEGAVKAAAALAVSVPRPHEIVLSGRLAGIAAVREQLAESLGRVLAAPVHLLAGFGTVAKQAAQGAALLADGLAGGRSAALVDALGIRAAHGTALDYLYVITPASARARLGIASEI